MLATALCLLFPSVAESQQAESVFFSRQVGPAAHADAAELARSQYQIEAIHVANHRPAPGAAPQAVFSFKQNRRGVSNHGDILNPALHPTKPLLLFTSDHDQERSLFKCNAFTVSTDGREYLQLSPYRSDGRWQAPDPGKSGTVTGRVQGPIAPETGAIVFIQGVVEGIRTDAAGNFAARNVPAGENLHVVAWKMSLHDPEVVRNYASDLNFGVASVTVAPGATVPVTVPLAYRGFGYAGEENPRSYLEYAAWGPDGGVYTVFGEKNIYQVHPTFRQVRDMGVFTRGIDYHPGRKLWALITAEGVVIAHATFKPLGTILTNAQLQAWLNDAWSQVGSMGLNNSCIRWAPGGQQVMFEIAGGRGILVYDFPTKRLHLPAWSQDRSMTFRIGSFSPDGAFLVCTVEYAAQHSRPTELHAVRWSKPQESYLLARSPGIQRACWGSAAPTRTSTPQER
jgi:hypothetical protein